MIALNTFGLGKPMKNIRYILPGLTLAAISILSTGCGEVPAKVEVERPVKTLVLGDTAVGASRAFPGTTRAADRAELSFRVSGPLVELPIYESKEVRKGEVLAQIDPRDFRTSVENLEASLASLQAERRGMNQARPEDIRRLEANLGAAKARLLEAEASFRRYQRLYENDNISKAEYDERRAARDVAVADVSRAEEELSIGQQGARVEDIEAMDARIRGVEASLRQAKDDLADSSLRAPYDGVVAQRFVDNFEFVQAQESILSLQNISVMELVAQVPETIIARARRDDGLASQADSPEFYALFPSLPGQRITANVTEVAAQADPVTRTYAVTFQLPQPEEGTILAGMTGEVYAQAREGSAVGFSVPVSSVFTDENGATCVWLLNEQTMTPDKAVVELGDLIGGSAMLLAGVSEGDTVITAGASYLHEEQRVRIITDELRERR
jgi:RND family efflux transporter MFP subunit